MTKKIITGEVIDIKHSCIARVKFFTGVFNSKLKKHIRRSSNLRAKFFEDQDIGVGDIVSVEECAPLSKTIFWVVKQKNKSLL